MHRCLTLSAVTLAMSLPLSAFAQQPAAPGCPPGAWFCEEAPADGGPAPAAPPPEAPPPAGDGATAPVTPPVTPAPSPYQPPAQQQPPMQGPPRGRVVYQQLPPPPPPGGYYYAIPAPPAAAPPPKPPKLAPTRWGLNLRMEGVVGRRGDGTGLGGVGLSFRFRPIQAFAVDLGIDYLSGVDYNGFDRSEVPLSVSGLLYLNPRSRVQVYVTGGVDWSFAHVSSPWSSPLLTERSDGWSGYEYSADYSYFGGHGGIGLEFRLARHFSLNVDGQFFARGRTDDGALPEFYDPFTHQISNSSAGGLFRFGGTFWW